MDSRAASYFIRFLTVLTKLHIVKEVKISKKHNVIPASVFGLEFSCDTGEKETKVEIT